MLKKIFSSLFVTTALTANLFAGGSHLNIGGSMTELDNYEYQPGATAGVDIMFGLDNIPWIEAGVSLNGGAIFLGGDAKTELETSTVPYGSGMFKFGLDFGQMTDDLGEGGFPLSISGLVGYGVGSINGDIYSGLAYGGAIELEFSKNYGLGVSHQEWNANVNGYDFKVSIESVYFTIKFLD